jgi:spore germination protein
MRKVILVLGLVLLLQLALVPASSAAPPPSGGFWHYVRYGETLFSIGRLYGVNAYSICHANGLSNCNYIWAGQSLWIPSYPYPQPHPYPYPYPHPYPYPGCIAYHSIHYGQTLYSIGRLYGVSPWAIAHANGIYNMNVIYAGQTLCIPDP